MLWRSEETGYQLDTTIPTSHHNMYMAAHSSAPNQPQGRSIIERLGSQHSPRARHDLREQLNERRSSEAKQMKEIEELQRENKCLRKEQDLTWQWMHLRAESRRQSQELPPLTFLDDEREPSEAPPQWSRTTASKQTRGRVAPSRKTLCSISEVAKSQPSTKPSRERGRWDKLHLKMNRYEWSLEQPWRNHYKKNREVEIGLFAKWIHVVAANPTLKILQFILYSRQSIPQEHVYRYKSAIGLKTNDEVVLCKAFPSTLYDKALTWFTSIKSKPSTPRTLWEVVLGKVQYNGDNSQDKRRSRQHQVKRGRVTLILSLALQENVRRDRGN